MIGHGWESCRFIFYAFAIIYLGGSWPLWTAFLFRLADIFN